MLRSALVLFLVVSCNRTHHDDRRTATGSAAPIVARPADSRIATFWSWFTQHARELGDDKNLEQTMNRISDELEKVEPGLIGEVAIEGTGHQLVLSADGHKELFPKVQAVYAARPAQIAGWSVIAFRPRAKPGEQGFSIEMGKQTIKPADVKFVSAPSDGKLDIEVFIPGFTNVDEMGSIGFVLLDHTVGEYDMETKIGGIDFASLDKAPPSARPLTDLPTQVDALGH